MERAKQIVMWSIIIAALALSVFLLTSKVFRLNVVVGDSMDPNYREGDLLICNRLLKKEFKTGEVIIFKEEGYLVKRVIARDGETVEIKDNRVYVNSQVLIENYVKNDDNMVDMPEETVPKDSVFVMGDNRDKSLDSRSNKVSFVNMSKVYGKVIINLSNLGINNQNYQAGFLICIVIILFSLERIFISGKIQRNSELINVLLVVTNNKLIRQKSFRVYLMVRGISLESRLKQFRGSEIELSQQINLIILGEDISKEVASCKYIGTYINSLIAESEESIQISLCGIAYGKRELRQRVISNLSTKSNKA